jgi:flagellar hook-associated protein 3
MRVAFNTLYDSTRYRLGQLTGDLNKANQVVVTGKRINTLSDDPVGLSQVLKIKSNLSNLNQLQRNIDTGRTWLDAGETALDSVKGLISDAKILSLAMSNDTVSASDRADAAGQIDGILDQILELANSRVNGQYIFSGTKTDIKPFEFDDPENPTEVDYFGNENPFSIKIGKDATVEAGHTGDVFLESCIAVDETNNKIDFSEDAGVTELTATINGGNYTADQLADEIESAMERASAENAFPAAGVDYGVSYDPSTSTFSIGRTDSGQLDLLWQSGTHAGTSAGPDIGLGESGDDTGSSVYNGVSGVQWSIFNTLIDLKSYLQSNDWDGIQRTLTRLDTHFNHMVTSVSEIGSKGTRLDMKENIIADLNLSYETNRSKLEDADILEAISDLNAKELAYQAALASSARVMQLSLVDYL